jgi:hypothetical protein
MARVAMRAPAASSPKPQVWLALGLPTVSSKEVAYWLVSFSATACGSYRFVSLVQLAVIINISAPAPIVKYFFINTTFYVNGYVIFPANLQINIRSVRSLLVKKYKKQQKLRLKSINKV